MREIAVVDNQIRVKLSGSIDEGKAAKIAEALRCFVESGLAIFVIDLSEVVFMDRLGLGSLVDIQERVRLRGGCVVIKGMNRFDRQPFDISGAKNRITCE